MEQAIVRWIILFLVICCISMATMMALAPTRVVRYATTSRVWLWYLTKVLCMTPERLATSGVAKWIRIQGIVGLLASLLALYAWIHG